MELDGLDADQKQMLRRLPEKLGCRQNLLKPCLVQAHLLRAEKVRNVVIFDELESAGREPVIDGVENNEDIGRDHMLDKVKALRAAIHKFDVCRKLVEAIQRLDRAHSKTFIGPEQIADAEDSDSRHFLSCRLVWIGASGCIKQALGQNGGRSATPTLEILGAATASPNNVIFATRLLVAFLTF